MLSRIVRNPSTEKLFYATWCIVLGGSSIASCIDLGDNFFTNDQNWLNQKMVKWGWGWTLYSLLAMSFIINLTEKNIMKNMFRNFTRIFIMGTSVWFVGTQLTFKIGDITGHCLDANLSRVAGVMSRRSCRALAGESTWAAFDISGHTFLLTWCLYLTSVEFKLFNTFRFKTHPFLIELIAFLLAGWIAVLNLLWLIMLVSTQLFFHSFIEKVLAKCLVDLFLIVFSMLNARLEACVPFNKAKEK